MIKFTSLVIVMAASLLAAPIHAADLAYTYDALGRLVTVTYPNGTVVTYTYDAAGNRTQKTVVP